MKTARFLFTIIGLGAFTLQLSLGDQQSGQPSDQGSAESRITPDSSGDHKNSKVTNQDQADIIYPRVGEHLRPFDRSSQIGPTKNGVLPGNGVLAVHRPLPAHGALTVHGVLATHGVLPANRVQPTHHPEMNHPKPVANRHEVLGQKTSDSPKTKQPSVYDLHPMVLKPSSAAIAKDGLLVNQTKNPPVELKQKLPATEEANASLPVVVHIRQGSTGTIGQLMPSSTKSSTAALSGIGIKLKR
jgi:hypothetical protein